MPKFSDIKKVLVIGSGPIIIGQAAEFDYAGTQACKSLREEGIQVVLINSNPATIMTDEDMADIVYIEPLTLDVVESIISREKPDGLLGSLGGQTGLNMAVELYEKGILDKYNVRLLGPSADAIKKAEDRDLFKKLMEEINEPIPKSIIVENVEDGINFGEENGYPVIVRPAYTLGGTGGGIANNKEELETILYKGLKASRINQALIEQSVAGWKEIEYEVMRDENDTCIVICNMENIDPVGIHTGDSIVVAPAQTLRAEECAMLKAAAIKIIKALKINGGCNVQFALDTKSKEYVVIEVNPRVSRSSALASKASGYPIAKIAAKVAIGLHLHEIQNYVTKITKASFEPTLDYVVLKIPRFPFDKFQYADRTLGTQMKATGEVMSIDRRFASAFLKAVISLEGKGTGLRRPDLEQLTLKDLYGRLNVCGDERIFVVAETFRKGGTVEKVAELTMIDPWFLEKIKSILDLERALASEMLSVKLLLQAEEMGFTDREIQVLSGKSLATIDTLRRAHGIFPVYKRVDTCGAEFDSKTPYYYSTYDKEDENVISGNAKVIVIGSGPIRIGQGIEFDYCSVHAAWAIQKCGYESIIINNNPETVSTDFDTADKLYFEPLFIEDVYNVIRNEMPYGVIVQFGGQTALNLAPQLVKRGVQILGTSMESSDVAEDRERFEILLRELNIPQPKGFAILTPEDAKIAARKVGYPVLVRPSYVIGGRAMQVVHNESELMLYVREALSEGTEHPILIDHYIDGKEVEVDAISDGVDILIPGIIEHIEHAGVHSGDSITVYPPQTLSQGVMDKLTDYTQKIARALQVKGLMNIQFVLDGENVYVIEVNPRASRTVPILSKVTGIPMVDVAVKIILGGRLAAQGYGTGLAPSKNLVAVKAPVFSFAKLYDVDPAMTPEMKSTGEVLGIGKTYEAALYKAFKATGSSFPTEGKVLLSVNEYALNDVLPIAKELDSLGYELAATDMTADFLQSKGLSVEKISKENPAAILKMIHDQAFVMVINVPTLGRSPERIGFKIRNAAIQYKLPLFTCLDTAKAFLLVIREVIKQGREIEYLPIREWNQK